jgi:hypothetical protein
MCPANTRFLGRWDTHIISICNVTAKVRGKMQKIKQATFSNSDCTCNMTVTVRTLACVYITTVSESSLNARGYVSFLDPCPTLQLPHVHVVENLSGWNLTFVPSWPSVHLSKHVRLSKFSTSRTSRNLPYLSQFLLCGKTCISTPCICWMYENKFWLPFINYLACKPERKSLFAWPSCRWMYNTSMAFNLHCLPRNAGNSWSRGQKATVVKPQRILYPHMLLLLKLFQIILSLKPISTTWYVPFRVSKLYPLQFLISATRLHASLISSHLLNSCTEKDTNFVKSTSYDIRSM